jgi:molybdopterin-biosynthesis enzyme MoeA-like protein
MCYYNLSLTVLLKMFLSLLAAVAKAFGESLIPHPELVKLVSDFYKTDDLSSAEMKMAHVRIT